MSDVKFYRNKVWTSAMFIALHNKDEKLNPEIKMLLAYIEDLREAIENVS